MSHPAQRRRPGGGDRLEHLIERPQLCPATSASQCGSAAAIPPARGANPGALERGLTHTTL